ELGDLEGAAEAGHALLRFDLLLQHLSLEHDGIRRDPLQLRWADVVVADADVRQPLRDHGLPGMDDPAVPAAEAAGRQGCAPLAPPSCMTRAWGVHTTR